MKYLFHLNQQDYIFENPQDGGVNKKQKPNFFEKQCRKRIQYVFSDAGLYLQLKKAPGCLSATISKVQVLYNDKCLMGLHVEYTAKLSDGTVLTTRATPHHHNHGKYARDGGKTRMYSFELKDGEYITDVLTRQSDITTQITFVTNTGRSESFGGNGGSPETPTKRSGNYRVVALTGTVNGVIETVGFFAEPVEESIDSLPDKQYRVETRRRLLEKKKRKATEIVLLGSNELCGTNGSPKKRRRSEV
jgi:hypothetical protein